MGRLKENWICTCCYQGCQIFLSHGAKHWQKVAQNQLISIPKRYPVIQNVAQKVAIKAVKSSPNLASLAVATIVTTTIFSLSSLLFSELAQVMIITKRQPEKNLCGLQESDCPFKGSQKVSCTKDISSLHYYSSYPVDTIN